MGIFDDKQYEEMDWLVKAIEPVISNKNTALSEIPEEIEITPQQLFEYCKTVNGTSIDGNSIIGNAITPYVTTEVKIKDLTKYFTIESKGHKNIVFDFVNNIAVGDPLVIKKTIQMIEEKDLLREMGGAGLDLILCLSHRDTTTERCNEIAELLGCDIALSKRSASGKLDEIRKSLSKHIKENTWNIKNVELADKVCQWIVLFLKDGNLAALTNFCKFKVMTHDGEAIYSIEEEPV